MSARAGMDGEAPRLEPVDRLAYELWLNGFILLPRFLPMDLVADMRKAIAPLVEAEWALVKRGWRSGQRSANRLSLDLSSWPASIRGALDDERLHRDPLVESVVTATLGAWRRGSFRLECPMPDTEYMGWHPDTVPTDDVDRPYRSFRLTLNVALVDIAPENGPMEIIPGSHRIYHDRRRPDDAMVPYARPMLMSAGDAFLRDGNGLHRGTPNRSSAPRLLLGVTYKSAGDPSKD